MVDVQQYFEPLNLPPEWFSSDDESPADLQELDDITISSFFNTAMSEDFSIDTSLPFEDESFSPELVLFEDLTLMKITVCSDNLF